MAASEEDRIIVVGAGIVGVSCAVFLQRAGLRVSVLDPRGPGGGASYGNAGVIAVSECVPVGTPGTLMRVPSMLLSRRSPLRIRWRYLPRLAPWLWRFVRSSSPGRVEAAAIALINLLKRAQAAHRFLIQAAGAEALVSDVGWLKVYGTDLGFKKEAASMALMQKLGVKCEHLRQDEIRQLEPALAPIFKHAIYHPECSQIADPKAYVEKLARMFVAAGGEIRDETVIDIDFAGSRARGVITNAGRRAACGIVVAAGAWSRHLAGRLGCRVPLDTERGYHLMLPPPREGSLQRPILLADLSVVLAPMLGGVRLTSSVEFAGLEAPADFRPIRRLLPEISRAVPGIGMSPTSEWLGFRPSMPDSLPVIGRPPGHRNCYLAFGHGHLGLTLGPITGQLIAGLVSEREPDLDLSPFRPDRF